MQLFRWERLSSRDRLTSRLESRSHKLTQSLAQLPVAEGKGTMAGAKGPSLTALPEYLRFIEDSKTRVVSAQNVWRMVQRCQTHEGVAILPSRR
jgi:hypothetical protein